MNEMLLKDKIILITGGSRGIGHHCAKTYARHGAIVVVIAIDKIETDRVVNELGPAHMGIVCDVADDTAVKQAIGKVVDKFGRIDAIHNNAGIAEPSKLLHETTSDEWDALMNVNVKGIYHTIKYGFNWLKESRGCILNTSSIVAEIGQEIHAAYSATKGAVNALTKSMALDYAKYHIRVNAVAPAAVWTPMLEKWNDAQPVEMRDSIENYLNNIHPIGYCPEGDVVADACLFLLSDMARFITGCIMPVSGGAELGYRFVQKENIGIKTRTKQ